MSHNKFGDEDDEDEVFDEPASAETSESTAAAAPTLKAPDVNAVQPDVTTHVDTQPTEETGESEEEYRYDLSDDDIIL